MITKKNYSRYTMAPIVRLLKPDYATRINILTGLSKSLIYKTALGLRYNSEIIEIMYKEYKQELKEINKVALH